MTIHFHIDDRPITVHSGDKGFTSSFGLRRITKCERCGFATNEFYELEGAFMCDNCYTEIMQLLNDTFTRGFLYE